MEDNGISIFEMWESEGSGRIPGMSEIPGITKVYIRTLSDHSQEVQ